MTQTLKRKAGRELQQLEAGITEARQVLSKADTRARAFVRQRPVAAMFAAVGVGYLLARIASRL